MSQEYVSVAAKVKFTLEKRLYFKMKTNLLFAPKTAAFALSSNRVLMRQHTTGASKNSPFFQKPLYGLRFQVYFNDKRMQKNLLFS